MQNQSEIAGFERITSLLESARVGRRGAALRSAFNRQYNQTAPDPLAHLTGKSSVEAVAKISREAKQPDKPPAKKNLRPKRTGPRAAAGGPSVLSRSLLARWRPVDAEEEARRQKLKELPVALQQKLDAMNTSTEDFGRLLSKIAPSVPSISSATLDNDTSASFRALCRLEGRDDHTANTLDTLQTLDTAWVNSERQRLVSMAAAIRSLRRDVNRGCADIEKQTAGWKMKIRNQPNDINRCSPATTTPVKPQAPESAVSLAQKEEESPEARLALSKQRVDRAAKVRSMKLSNLSRTLREKSQRRQLAGFQRRMKLHREQREAAVAGEVRRDQAKKVKDKGSREKRLNDLAKTAAIIREKLASRSALRFEINSARSRNSWRGYDYDKPGGQLAVIDSILDNADLRGRYFRCT